MKKVVKTTAQLLALPQYQNMVSQTYLDTKLHLTTKDRHMQAGETRTFDLTMVEDYESFEGTEVIKDVYPRNPKVFKGEYINVIRDKQGHYMVTLHKLEMKQGFNAIRIANAIRTELLTAKRNLGL